VDLGVSRIVGPLQFYIVGDQFLIVQWMLQAMDGTRFRIIETSHKMLLQLSRRPQNDRNVALRRLTQGLQMALQRNSYIHIRLTFTMIAILLGDMSTLSFSSNQFIS